MMNYFKLIFSNNSILRILQNEEFKRYKITGKSIEFGANFNIERNFLKEKSKKYQTIFSNVKKKKNFLYLNLQKKIKHKKKYNNVIIFNVLEHLPDINFALKNLNSLLKKNGNIIGSTPFIYRIHGAPNDYCRYTHDYIKLSLKKNKFKNIKIRELGLGPFLASYSLLRGYLKYLPIIYQVLLLIVLIIDRLIYLFMKNDHKKIYPIGYIFSATKI